MAKENFENNSHKEEQQQQQQQKKLEESFQFSKSFRKY